MSLTFEHLSLKTRIRTEESFHKIHEWSPSDWAVAMAGECGEACNMVKKLRRINGPTIEKGRANSPVTEECISRIGLELADMVIYADLLAQRLGLNLSEQITKKFNIVSERVGSSVRL